MNDEFFNSFVIREAFEYAFGAELNRDHWLSSSRQDRAERPHSREIAYSVERVRTALSRADAYIITLGLSEVWYNRRDGTVYPSGLNITSFDPALHAFRVATVEENLENIEAIYGLIRGHYPRATVVFTVSPVPLAATFRDMTCIAANSVSKAILRLAVDRLLESHKSDERLFYYPAYEIVRDYFLDPFGHDMRHVKDPVIEFVVDQFLRKFFVD